ncbi:MAG: cell division protein SepF [Clostridiales bacterium]|nr:cell division protein SepF [Clostridiales bacterium]
MDFRELTKSAADRIKSVFSKDNRFFYGTSEHQEEAYQEEVSAAPMQGTYLAYGQPVYQQQAAPAQQGPYQQPMYQQPYQPQAHQPQTPVYQQQQFTQQAAPMNSWQAQGYQQPVQQYTAPQQHYSSSPQQAQIEQQPDQSGRNRRAAQHTQAPQQQDNIVQFPGAAHDIEPKMVDAYVVNITNINGCRQAMTCLRKGQCTLVVMDQLIDKAEVRRYVDMLNGACFALGGTMTRLSVKVGFYILAPSGMMVYTDPITASANAPARPQPQAQPVMQQQAYQQPQPVFQHQQPVYQPQPAPQQAAYAPQQSPYAPPVPQKQESYNAQRYAQ